MQNEPRRHSAVPHLFLMTTMLLFGSAFASSKVVVGRLDHQAAAALRFGGGALVLVVALLLVRGRGARLSGRDRLRVGAIGLLGVFAYNLLFFWGLSLSSAIDGSVIVPVLSPVLTVAILTATRRESPSAIRIAGLALGVAGAVVFMVGAGGHGGGARLLGDVIFLLAAACWAVYTIVSKEVLVGLDPLRATVGGTLTGAVALVVVGAPSLVQTDWAAVPGATWANLAYLAIGPTAAAYLLYYSALRTVSSSTATVAMFAVPVVGTLCSMVFLGESFTGVQLAGVAVMLPGALMATHRRPAAPVAGATAGRARGVDQG